VTIRELFVKLGVQADEDEVDSFSSSMASAKSQMKAAVAAATAVVSAIAAVTAAAAAAALEVGRYGKKLLQNAEIAQTTVRGYQVLTSALKRYGIEADQVRDTLNELSVRMNEARKGTGPAAGAFEELGVSIEDSNGNLRDANEVFREAISKLGQIENKTKRAALAEKLFGGEFRKLMPLIAEGTDSIAEMREKMEAFGLLMGKDAAEAASDFRKKLGFVRKVFMAIVRELGIAVIPIFDAVLDRILAWTKANRDLISTGIRKFAKGLAVVIKGLTVVLSPLDDLFRLFVGNMQAVAAVMGGILLTALGAVATLLVTTWIPAAWGAVAPFWPLIGVVAALSVVIWELINVMTTGESVIVGWLESFAVGRMLIDAVQMAFRKLQTAIDMVLVVFQRLSPAFELFKSVAAAVLQPIIGLVKILGRVLKLAGRVILFSLRAAFTVLLQIAVSVFKTMIRWLQRFAAFAAPVFQYILSIFQPVAESMRSIWGNVFDFVMSKIDQLVAGFEFIRKKISEIVGIELGSKKQKIEQDVEDDGSGPGPGAVPAADTAKRRREAQRAAGSRAQRPTQREAAQNRRQAAAQGGDVKVEGTTVEKIEVNESGDPEETRRQVREELEEHEKRKARKYKELKKGQEAGERGGGSS